ncbi:DUF6236 family protein, partial [Streptomyces sp. BF23-19]|uniref:DUF6236 family protein n=2 Tax=Streptomyces TaxID=1883 RepID=UPI0034E4F16F
MDPALTWAYKCALTQELARQTAFAPVTDQLEAHTAAGNWTLRGAQARLWGLPCPGLSGCGSGTAVGFGGQARARLI